MSTRALLTWIAVGIVAVGVIAVALPRALPLLPDGWEVSGKEAEAIALQAFTLFGELPDDPLIVVEPHGGRLLERQMLEVLGQRSRRDLLGDRYLQDLAGWRITVYPPGAPPHEWRYRATVSWDGTLARLRMNMPAEAEAGRIDEATARNEADALLRRAGFDLSTLDEPEVRSEQLANRTDLVLRYPVREPLLAERIDYGIQVSFLGDQLGGFSPWREDPADRSIIAELQQETFVVFGSAIVVVVLLLLVAVPFMRKYHHGEIGVRRIVELFTVTAASGLVAILFSARVMSEGTSAGLVPRGQMTLLVGVWAFAFLIVPSAILGALAWAVGESNARVRWGHKLAAFDAIFRGTWANATVASSSLRGVVLGLVLLAAVLALAIPLGEAGYHALASQLVETSFSSGWAGVVQILFLLSQGLPAFLVSCLLFPTLGPVRWSLRARAIVAALAATAVVLPALLVLPLQGGVVVWVVFAAVPTLVFARWDLLSALLTGLVANAVLWALPMLLADDSWLQFQATLPLLFFALPLIGSLRFIQTGGRFEYSYDDVPPHVRRIAERERQRVELETAREIQGAILPDLPPQLAGVELAHVYQPATEVGGDFYDVLALEDGRLAVAVGDVAGHGVSSGLVMSMVKSALSVQVTFDPDVESVMTALNRMVYQSARRRMLTTLSYAILDPERRRLVYASAGHIFPLRVSAQGWVHELEAGQYPLGVRPEFETRVHAESLEPGDAVVLLSDGIVERTPEHDHEPFGFDRLRRSLERSAGQSAKEMVRSVLRDLDDHTGQHPREDDVTLLVLKLPA